jgi:hypothetical protein
LKQNTHILIMSVIAVALLMVAVEQEQTFALAILKFTVPKNAVAVGERLTVTGTSMAPNATAANCNVQLQTNQDGYQPVTGTGPAGPLHYVNWTGTTEPMIKGLNSIEAQLQCFPQGHTTGQDSLLKHLVHNVTAIEASTAASPPAGPGVPGLPVH